MMGNRIFSMLADVLLPWYDTDHRELPWRANKDPYCIWVSEIMLQQTRVEAVKGYYTRFLEKMPTIADLAKADDALLQKLWEGLGYYSRVRNMKKAAQIIMDCYDGVFPREYDAVLALPGIGEYTAGAICSIAYDQPTPAVDGNVLRVVARLTDNDTPVDTPVFKASVRRELTQIYPHRAGDFTQALMELGATLCGPNRKPNCENCPCNGFCKGYIHGTAELLPVRQPKKKRRIEEKTVFILSCDGYYALQKRPADGLLAGLWQFPNISGKLSLQQVMTQVEDIGVKPRELLRVVERKHVFTHIEWHMSGVYMEVVDPTECYTWLTAREIRDHAALPTAFRQFFEEIENV